jgi:hypothetical protein
MGIKVKLKERQRVPDGTYVATINGVGEVDGKFGKQVQIEFRLVYDPYRGELFSRFFPVEGTERSILGRLIHALYGKDAPEGEYDTDDWIGKGVRIKLETTNGPKGKWIKVTDILPVKMEGKDDQSGEDSTQEDQAE